MNYARFGVPWLLHSGGHFDTNNLFCTARYAFGIVYSCLTLRPTVLTEGCRRVYLIYAGTVYGGTVAAATPGRSPYRDAGTEWPISDSELCLSDNVNN